MGAVVGAVALVVVALIANLFQLLIARNDRVQASQEVDLLAKLDPQSQAAQRLNEVVEGRIARWHQRMFKPSRDRRDYFGEAVAESMKPRDKSEPLTLRAWLWTELGGSILNITFLLGGVMLGALGYFLWH